MNTTPYIAKLNGQKVFVELTTAQAFGYEDGSVMVTIDLPEMGTVEVMMANVTELTDVTPEICEA